jgi:thiamine pyrophosphokinase
MNFLQRFLTVNPCDYRSMLCLNGQLPEKSFFDRMNLPIYAVDGALNQLIPYGITPCCVMGDLDSVLPEYDDICQRIYLPDQNYSDFEKSLRYMDEQGMLPTLIVGLDGGNLAHILYNISVFMQTSQVFYAPPIIGLSLLKGEKKTLTLDIDTKVSLLAMPEAEVTTQGLYWELDSEPLSFLGKNSLSNRTLIPEVVIEVFQGCLLCLLECRLPIDEREET